MKTIFITATPGTSCPAEMSRRQITDSEILAVPETAYYLRRIAAGALVQKTEEDYNAQMAARAEAAKESAAKPKGKKSAS